ncbi:MAG: phosphatidylinositol-specific phospholipase C1-like protein [Acidimicrobiales bacterium]|nr:phosphatidylinositol-specific phospholipase C1-like protein [Acidimicrobiales bacterium]
MSHRNRRFAPFAAAAAGICMVVAAVGVGVSGAGAGGVDRSARAVPGDDVRLNEIQVVGSHNSYKVLPSQAEQDMIRSFIGAAADRMQYQHAPLPVQFESQKVRQIELDVWVDSAGGRYRQPLLRSALDLGPYQPEIMDLPGTKTFHIQDVDYGSTCPSFVGCLEAVKGWSDANQGHVPIAILVELKDTPLEVGDFDFTDPELWTAEAMNSLDAEIRSVFPESSMITPDDVRGSRSTLREAVIQDGWPTLGESRGQVMFMMDNGGGYRDDYVAGHPSLEGRVLFTNADPDDDDAAFIKRNDPFDPSIPDLVEQGFVVRTRSDSDTLEARANDTGPRDAALASGAQWVSTDYPVPGMAVGFETPFYVEIPGGTVARCNPVNAPPSCDSGNLEDLDGPVRPPSSVPPTSSSPNSSVPSSSVPSSTSRPGGTTAPGSSTTRPGTTIVPAPRPPAPPATGAQPRTGQPSYTG